MDSVKSVLLRSVSLSVQLIEEQARGALHFHVAVAGRQMYALLRSIWQGILGRGPHGKQMGQFHVRDPHRFGFGVAGAHKIASYIAKYCGKEMQCRALDQKRYFRYCHKWWTIIRSDSYSTLIDGEEGRAMANFDADSLRILKKIED